MYRVSGQSVAFVSGLGVGDSKQYNISCAKCYKQLWDKRIAESDFKDVIRALEKRGALLVDVTKNQIGEIVYFAMLCPDCKPKA